MELQQHGRPVLGEIFEDVELPQRLRAVERTGQHSTHRAFELEAPAR
jgi:hypothetical protein